MKKLGTVLIFKDDVSREEAAAALESIAGVLDLPDTMPVGRTVHKPDGPQKRCQRVVSPDASDEDIERIKAESPGHTLVAYDNAPFEIDSYIREFDPEWGSPAWYIP